MVEEMKVCKKCGKSKPLSEFGNVKKNGVTYKVGTCKQCTAEYKKEFHQQHKEREYEQLKERRKVNHDADLKKYAENADKINEKRRENYEKKKEEINNKRREKRNENKEAINKQKREWYEKNKEGIHEQRSERSKTDKEYAEKNAERAAKWYSEHKEEAHNLHISYYNNNKDKVAQMVKLYNKTPKGREVKQKAKAARRLLGYAPINSHFVGSEYHHLRHVKETGSLDNDIGVYIPAGLHKSIKHDGNTGRNMKKMNFAALDWYVNNTPRSKIKQYVLDLYTFYKLSSN